MRLTKIQNGFYRYVAVSELAFDVFLHERREYNYNTGAFRNVRTWSWKAGTSTNDGYATKAQAAEAALRYIGSRA